MFTRQSSQKVIPPERSQEPSFQPPPVAPSRAADDAVVVEPQTAAPQQPTGPAPSQHNHSVIGPDLKILGGGLRLVSEGNLTVDGTVEGDVLGANVVIGPHGHVNGLIHGETVSIAGKVAGTVRAVDVSLKNGAQVEAEVHHNTLSLELGASFEGRSRRYFDRADLVPDLREAGSPQPAATASHEPGAVPPHVPHASVEPPHGGGLRSATEATLVSSAAMSPFRD